jgi:hypothetical protein
MVTPRTRRKRTPKRPPEAPPPRMLTAAQVAKAAQTMAEPSGSARFRAGKALSITAEKSPDRVYPHFDAIAALLKSDSRIVCWNAIQILTLLAPADQGCKLDRVCDTFLAFIRGDNLVSAANAIGGLCRIARTRPDWIDRIIPPILEVETATYATPECRNVAIQQTLGAFATLGPGVCQRPDVAAFIRRQRTNPRAKVAKLAERMAANLSA